MKRFVVVFVAGIVGLGAGCRPAPIRAIDVGPLPSAEAALQTLRQNGALRRTIRAEGRVTYYGDQGRVRVRLEVVARRADQFRVATISPFEQPIDVMACDGRDLWLLSKGELKMGPATPSNVARLLPLPLAPSEIVDTMMGGVPTGQGFTAESLTRASDEQWILTLARDGAEEHIVLTVDPARWVVVRAVIERPAGQPYVQAVFEDFMDLEEGGYYPEKIHMTMPGRDVDVRLKLKRPEFNATIDDGLFRMTAPPGQRIRAL